MGGRNRPRLRLGRDQPAAKRTSAARTPATLARALDELHQRVGASPGDLAALWEQVRLEFGIARVQRQQAGAAASRDPARPAPKIGTRTGR
jgi:hypothetical protein